jgi:hypothetical protein
MKLRTSKKCVPLTPTSFPLSFHHTPCRLRIVKAHKHKKWVKRYLARKARYLDGKAKHQASLAAHGNQSTAVLSEAVEETVDVSSDESKASRNQTSQVPESPVRIKPIKPITALLLSPDTCIKIANKKAAALKRRAAIEAGLKCAICEAILSVQDSDQLCADCLLNASKEDSEPEGKSRGVTVTGEVKKEKKLKKAVALLKIDFEEKAIAFEEDGSQMKSRVKKTPKIFDV